MKIDDKARQHLTGLRDSIDGVLSQEEGTKAPQRRFVFPGGAPTSSKFGGLDNRSGVKVHHGAHGQVYELKSGTRLSDVIEPEETPEISLDRWLAAAMLGDHCEDKTALEYAGEMKSVSGGTTGTLIPVGYQAEWIDNMRSFMVLEATGMTTATMNARTVASSRIVSDPTVSWRAEGAAVGASDPTMELRNLVAKSLAVRVQATAELAQDSPDFGNQLMMIMGKALALEVDRAGIMGTGSGSTPRGIVNTSGILSVGGVGLPVQYDLMTGMQRLLESNVPLDRANKNAIMSPRTWNSLESAVSADGQPILRYPALQSMAYRPTTSVPDNLGVGTNESMIVLGDFADMVLGVRMEASIEALRLQSYADNLLLEFIGWTRVDFLVRRPASFCVLTGVTL